MGKIRIEWTTRVQEDYAAEVDEDELAEAMDTGDIDSFLAGLEDDDTKALVDVTERELEDPFEYDSNGIRIPVGYQVAVCRHELESDDCMFCKTVYEEAQ